MRMRMRGGMMRRLWDGLGLGNVNLGLGNVPLRFRNVRLGLGNVSGLDVGLWRGFGFDDVMGRGP